MEMLEKVKKYLRYLGICAFIFSVLILLTMFAVKYLFEHAQVDMQYYYMHSLRIFCFGIIDIILYYFVKMYIEKHEGSDSN